MKNILYIVFLAGILFPGCINTQGILKINGKVIDEYTKEPIATRNIFVQALVGSGKSLVTVDAGNFTTDSSGYFTYSLRKVKDAYSYNFCLVGDSDYLFKTDKVALSYLERNAKYLSFSLSKLAEVSFIIFKESETAVCDTLFLSWRSNGILGGDIYPYKINNYGLTSGKELKWIGRRVESTVKTRAFADSRTIVRWVLYRNGQKKEISDTIICKRDKVNEVYIRY